MFSRIGNHQPSSMLAGGRLDGGEASKCSASLRGTDRQTHGCSGFVCCVVGVVEDEKQIHYHSYTYGACNHIYPLISSPEYVARDKQWMAMALGLAVYREKGRRQREISWQ